MRASTPAVPVRPGQSAARAGSFLRLAACFLLRASELAYAEPTPATLTGQTVGTTSSAIYGTVTDSTGASLPDARVVISSDALIGDNGRRSGVTTPEGFYRFTALPPGDYTLAFARDGFKTVERTGVHVGIGFTARIDVQMEVATVRQHVTVTPPSPVVDGSTTAVTVPFDANQLANLPSSRTLFGILTATPAVQVACFEVGGNKVHRPCGFGAYGIRGRNRPMVEGINVTGVLVVGFPLDYGSFEEVSVLTAAHSAEWDSPGVHAQFVVKSGGNRYRGAVYADYQNRNWQAFNVDEDQIRRGVEGGGGLSAREANRQWSYHDINADAGGYLKRDRIWWYFSFRQQEVAERRVNFLAAPFRASLTSYSAKGTFRPSENHTFIAFGQAGRNHQPYLLNPAAIHESEESTAEQRGRGWIWKGEWNGTIRDTVFVELRAGAFGSRRAERPNGAAPSIEDIGTQTVRGSALDWREDLQRDQVLGSLSYHLDGWHGSHQLEAGGRMYRTISGSWTHGYFGDVLHFLENGAPIEVRLYQTPSAEASGLWEYGAYIDDSWQVNDRLTLNLGMRFDRSRVFLPEQIHPASRFNPRAERFSAVDNLADWNVMAPRLGLIYDVTGSGSTLAKFTYNRYVDGPGRTFGYGLNPNASTRIDAYTWSDANGSGIWEPGEEEELIGSDGGGALERVDPQLQLPHVKEATARIQHQFAAGLALSTGVVWRGVDNAFASQDVNRPFEAYTAAVDVPDPGPDDSLGTGDDGGIVRVYEVGPEYVDLPFVNVVRNVAGPGSNYWTWEVATDKRFGGRWSVSTGFDYTWSHDSVFALTPNDLINAPGGQHRSTSWTAKLYGTYAAPWNVLITPLLRHQSGAPFGRTFVAELERDIVEIPAEPINTRRTDNVTLLDLRVEKGVRLPKDRRAAVFVDVYNILNANPEEELVQSSGPAFLQPLSIVAPRIARVGVKLNW